MPFWHLLTQHRHPLHNQPLDPPLTEAFRITSHKLLHKVIAASQRTPRRATLHPTHKTGAHPSHTTPPTEPAKSAGIKPQYKSSSPSPLRSVRASLHQLHQVVQLHQSTHLFRSTFGLARLPQWFLHSSLCCYSLFHF
jgi:hypothetical protein